MAATNTLPAASPQPAAPPGEREVASAPSAATAASALPGYPATLPASSSFSPGPLAAGLLLAALAAAAFVMARRRRSAPRLVEVLEQTSLGPKRALVVARMGDELLVLGSSEGGIALLATRPAVALPGALASCPPPPAKGEGRGEGGRAAPLTPPLSPLPRGEGEHRLLSIFARLGRRAPSPSFDATLAESVEDVELRRKLSQGQRGSVR